MENIESGIEAYWRKYRLLKIAGYDYKTARKLAKNPPEAIQFLVTVGRKKKHQWVYQPFDKGYTQPFAYKVNYEVITEETGDVTSKWLTIISDREMSYSDVEEWTLDLAQGVYGETFKRIADVIPMRAGLKGGVR